MTGLLLDVVIASLAHRLKPSTAMPSLTLSPLAPTPPPSHSASLSLPPSVPQLIAALADISSARDQLRALLPSLCSQLALPSLEYVTVTGTSYLIEVGIRRDAESVPCWSIVHSCRRCSKCVRCSFLTSWEVLLSFVPMCPQGALGSSVPQALQHAHHVFHRLTSFLISSNVIPSHPIPL